MVDRALFNTQAPRVPGATDRNVEGNPAYALRSSVALAQLACTGTLGDSFYASAGDQLDELLAMCDANEPEWIARVAAYARKHGHMKDAPSVLMSYLAVTSADTFEQWAPAVIDNGRMVRNLVQILRSTRIVGQKALPRAVRRYLRAWLNNRSPRALLNDSVGTAPSIADIVKMVHAKPKDPERSALFGFLLGKAVEADAGPQIVRELLAYRAWVEGGEVAPVPAVDFRLLTGASIDSPKVWSEIALASNWHTLRMNLATFARHGVYADEGVVIRLADKLRNPETIRKARVWPSQLWAAWKRLQGGDIPREIMGAVQDALEISVESVPVLEGGVILCPDDSGSMQSPLTGYRQESTSVSLGEMAAVMAYAVLKRNPDAEILKFSSTVSRFTGNPRDSLVTLVGKYVRELNGGYTHMALPFAVANEQRWKHRTIWYISDNAANADRSRYGHGTELAEQFAIYKRRVPEARMILHNLQPYATSQAEGADVLDVGGFADTVFQVAADFARDGKGPDVWISRISSIEPPQ